MPVGVRWPSFPVDTLATPICTPLRETLAIWSGRLTTITSGPSGAAPASQMNSPGFSFDGFVPAGEDSFAPQKGTGAARTIPADRARAASPGTRRRNRNKLRYRVRLLWREATPEVTATVR